MQSEGKPTAGTGDWRAWSRRTAGDSARNTSNATAKQPNEDSSRPAAATATKMGQVQPIDDSGETDGGGPAPAEEKEAKSPSVLVPPGRERPLRTRSQVFKSDADLEDDAVEERAVMLLSGGTWVMSPDCAFRRRWDVLQAIILLYISIMVPIRVGFKIVATGPAFVLECAFDLYFYIDVVLNFFTGYFDEEEGCLVLNHRLVAHAYARSWFTVDIIACLPFELVIRASSDTLLCSFLPDGCDESKYTSDGDPKGGFGGGDSSLLMVVKLLRLVRLAKLLRLMRLGRLLDRYQDDLFHLFHLLSVVKLAVVLLYLGHIFGCFFYFFSDKEWRAPEEMEDLDVEGCGDLPWLLKFYNDVPVDKFDSDFSTRYIASLYWAFTTMTTVGYGDISATTRAERMVAILGMIIGGFVFSGIISTMAEVLQAVNLSKQAKRHKIDCVSAFIRDAHLPSNFTRAVLAFFRRQDVKAYDERALLMEMPYELRHGILEHTYRDIIVKVPLFDVNGDGKVDDHVFVTELCSRMHKVTFAKGSLIFQRGEIATHMFVIWTGVVEVMDGKLERVITLLDTGSYFGEGALLGELCRRENMRARTMVDLCKLETNDMKGLLQYYPHLVETLQKTKAARKGLFDGETPINFEKLQKPNVTSPSSQNFGATMPGASVGEVVNAVTSNASPGHPAMGGIAGALASRELSTLKAEVGRLSMAQRRMEKKLDSILAAIERVPGVGLERA